MAPLKLLVKIASGSTVPIEVEPTLTVKEVKEVVAEASGVPAIQQVRCRGHRGHTRPRAVRKQMQAHPECVDLARSA